MNDWRKLIPLYRQKEKISYVDHKRLRKQIMCLIIDDSCFSFSGGTFVRAKNNNVEIIRNGVSNDVDAKQSVQWIKVSPDGRTVLIYAMNGTMITRWREDNGLDFFANDGSRNE